MGSPPRIAHALIDRLWYGRLRVEARALGVDAVDVHQHWVKLRHHHGTAPPRNGEGSERDIATRLRTVGGLRDSVGRNRTQATDECFQFVRS
jgi:hypothetical protein